MVTPMARRELRRLARDLRALGRTIRSFDMAAHLASTAKPVLKAGDVRTYCARRYRAPSVVHTCTGGSYCKGDCSPSKPILKAGDGRKA